VAGAGDAVFGADVGDFHGCWILGIRIRKFFSGL
jgi:hypothetical protein